LTSDGLPKAFIRYSMVGDTTRAITGSSGRSRAAAMMTCRLTSSSLVRASTPEQ